MARMSASPLVLDGLARSRERMFFIERAATQMEVKFDKIVLGGSTGNGVMASAQRVAWPARLECEACSRGALGGVLLAYARGGHEPLSPEIASCTQFGPAGEALLVLPPAQSVQTGAEPAAATGTGLWQLRPRRTTTTGPHYTLRPRARPDRPLRRIHSRSVGWRLSPTRCRLRPTQCSSSAARTARRCSRPSCASTSPRSSAASAAMSSTSRCPACAPPGARPLSRLSRNSRRSGAA
jgi:hypothetical protein